MYVFSSRHVVTSSQHYSVHNVSTRIVHNLTRKHNEKQHFARENPILCSVLYPIISSRVLYKVLWCHIYHSVIVLLVYSYICYSVLDPLFVDYEYI